MIEFEYKELEKSTHNFSNSSLIGKGSHGLIYQANLPHNNNKNLVSAAIKRSSESLKDNSKLENEISILSSIPENNPHIIKFYGISHDSHMNKLLVMEYMPNGSLHELLHGSSEALTWPRRVKIAIQIAKAVAFLHRDLMNLGFVIVHRDLKSENILFDASWKAKLADFGFSIKLLIKQGCWQVDSLSRPAGTLGYIDPSYTTACQLDTKNDVYSFGVVLLEIMSSKKVIDVSRVPSSIVDWATLLVDKNRTLEICDSNTTLPMFSESIVLNVLAIAMRCVSSNRNLRPTMIEVVTEMENCPMSYRVSFFCNWTNVMILLRRRRKLAAAGWRRLQGRKHD